MTEAATAGVHLDIERVAFDVALQLDEMVATAQRAELRDAAFGPTLAAPGYLPGVVDREPIAFGARSIDALTEVLRVVCGTAADDGFEFLLAQMLQTRTADLPRTEGDPPGHRAVEAQPIIRRCGRDGHVAGGRHHAATNVVADGSHSYGTGLRIGQEHCPDGHAVAVMDIRRDRDQ